MYTYKFLSVVVLLVCLSGCGSDGTPLEAGSTDTQDGNGGADGSNNADGDAGNQNGEEDNTGANGNNPDGDPAGTDPGGTDTQPQQEFEVAYRLRFDATWSAETHPFNFPSNPHFSPLVGAGHSDQSVFWQSAQIATDGIKQMAETGGTDILSGEVQFAIDEGRALAIVEGGPVELSPGSTSVGFVVDRNNPNLTVVSMLAPSPDWFVGVNSLSLLDDNGDFISGTTIDLRLYDAGTDAGLRFTSEDIESEQRSPIQLVTSFPMDTDFTSGEPFVGRFVIAVVLVFCVRRKNISYGSHWQDKSVTG